MNAPFRAGEQAMERSANAALDFTRERSAREHDWYSLTVRLDEPPPPELEQHWHEALMLHFRSSARHAPVPLPEACALSVAGDEASIVLHGSAAALDHWSGSRNLHYAAQLTLRHAWRRLSTT